MSTYTSSHIQRDSTTSLLIGWLVKTVAVIVAAYVLPGVSVSGFLAAFVAAVVIGFVNTVLRPLFIFLTLPITLLSMGLFTLVINAVLILLASAIVPGFVVAGFWWALLFSIVLWLVNAVLIEIGKR